jgi:hypothetical protein
MTLSLKNAYTVAPDDGYLMSHMSWVAESFQVVDSHRVVQTLLKMWQNATLFAGAISVSIYASDGTKPTGAPLITKWLDWTGLTTSWPPDTVVVDWGGGIWLSTGWYAIVCRGYFIDYDYAPRVAYKMASSSPRLLAVSNDQGTNWSTTNNDLWFENWGDDGTAYGPPASWLASHPDCVALWRGEPWKQFSDESGEGNHFWAASYARPNTAHKEGIGSMYLATGWAELRVADQSANLPLRNASYDLITVVAWFNVAAGGLPASGNRRDIVRKGSGYANFRVCVYNDSGTCRIQVGHGYNAGANWEYATLTTVAIAEGSWYHVTVLYDATANTVKIRLLAGSAISEVEVTWSQAMSYNDDAWRLGGWDQWIGWLDEVALFNEILPKDDIEEIEGLGPMRVDKRQHKWQCW